MPVSSGPSMTLSASSLASETQAGATGVDPSLGATSSFGSEACTRAVAPASARTAPCSRNVVKQGSRSSLTSAGETATYRSAVSSARRDRVRSAMTRLPFRS